MTRQTIYGIHAVSLRLQQSPHDCHQLICVDRLNSRLRALVDLARKSGIEVSHASRDSLSERCGSDKHQGVEKQDADDAENPAPFVLRS